MATNNINDVVILSKETVQALKRMKELGSKVFSIAHIAFGSEYAKWSVALEQSISFWDEINFRERVSIAIARSAEVTLTADEVTKLSEFAEATAQLLKALGGLEGIELKINNYKYQYDCVKDFFETVRKKEEE